MPNYQFICQYLGYQQYQIYKILSRSAMISHRIDAILNKLVAMKKVLILKSLSHYEKQHQFSFMMNQLISIESDYKNYPQVCRIIQRIKFNGQQIGQNESSSLLIQTSVLECLVLMIWNQITNPINYRENKRCLELLAENFKKTELKKIKNIHQAYSTQSLQIQSSKQIKSQNSEQRQKKIDFIKNFNLKVQTQNEKLEPIKQVDLKSQQQNLSFKISQSIVINSSKILKVVQYVM